MNSLSKCIFVIIFLFSVSKESLARIVEVDPNWTTGMDLSSVMTNDSYKSFAQWHSCWENGWPYLSICLLIEENTEYNIGGGDDWGWPYHIDACFLDDYYPVDETYKYYHVFGSCSHEI